jgi:hypothetical protein
LEFITITWKLSVGADKDRRVLISEQGFEKSDEKVKKLKGYEESLLNIVRSQLSKVLGLGLSLTVWIGIYG